MCIKQVLLSDLYSYSTIYLQKRVPGRKPLLRPAKIQRRKKWADEMATRPLEFWQTVIFSDESHFTLFRKSGRGTQHKHTSSSSSFRWRTRIL
uniref:Transposase n=1 Tax=Eptatretus burgeri TaxID=7764 RepID=A0A8C4QDI4_EPTBU